MIKEIAITNFKKHLYWSSRIDGNLILIHGANGIGKTSILEAISLFSPGSGIFGNDIQDLMKKNSQEAILQSIIPQPATIQGFEIAINAGFKLNFGYFNEKKEIKINSSQVKNLDLLEYIRIYGLNPYIALAFWKDSEVRRKHIDRLVMQNNPIYASLWSKYSKTLKERSRLISIEQFNSQWAAALEPILIETGLKIAEIRTQVIENLLQNLSQDLLDFLGSALKIEMFPNLDDQQKIFSKPLEASFLGPHRTKFELLTQAYSHTTASTAEQKKMLLALTLSALPKNSDTTNILLLDDLFSTLDVHSSEKLLQILSKQQFQTFITHTQDLDMDLAMQKILLG